MAPAVLMAGSLAIGLAAAERPPEAIALHDVTVVDARTGRAQTHRTVELREGRIAGVAEAATYRAATDVRLVAMPGRFVVPGFVEMHAHLWTHPWDDTGAHGCL
jgi:N-acyl-D-aspartate/D-glutamate deacylase